MDRYVEVIRKESWSWWGLDAFGNVIYSYYEKEDTKDFPLRDIILDKDRREETVTILYFKRQFVL